jgi:hypothetical protein
LGQLFIHADLLNGSQIGHKYKRGKSNSALTYWFSSKLDPSTPKAFANVSPGLERSDNPGEHHFNMFSTLKGFAGNRPFQGLKISFLLSPRVVAALQP